VVVISLGTVGEAEADGNQPCSDHPRDTAQATQQCAVNLWNAVPKGWAVSALD